MSKVKLQAPAGEMLQLLEELAGFSAPGPGVTRLLYTPEWSGAQRFLQEKMAGAGLEPRTDEVGNVYGRLSGTDVQDKVILTGSHIDTVMHGGKYDGAYGIAAAIIALGYLRDTCGMPRRTLEVVSFGEEEGSRFPLTFWGSGHVTGLYSGSEAAGCTDSEGITLEDAMTACGYSAQAGDSLRQDIGAYVELHIEQGIVLERAAMQIGVVQAIAGQKRYIISVGGSANHAGTTPMGLRRDALAGAAEMLLWLERSAQASGDPLVATSGRLETYPGTPNVIPGDVRFTLDIRHSEAEKLDEFCSGVVSSFGGIAARRGLTLEWEETLSTVPAPMDPKLSGTLERICREQGLMHLRMVSGAGHDAQLFAPRCPAAMIFVPSREGISHSPDEYSSPGELAAGLNVLTALLYELAYLQN